MCVPTSTDRMSKPTPDPQFSKAQKEYVQNQLNRFGFWFEEWDDGSSPKEDITNLTIYNSSEFIKKLLNWVYVTTLMFASEPKFKKIKTLVDLERCKKHPQDIHRVLSDLYLGGAECKFGSVLGPSFSNFDISFRFLVSMVEKLNEMEMEESTGVRSKFVEKLLQN
jgi:hypothetical protein